MRSLPKEINYAPKILLLKFSRFFVFGVVAAFERIIIFDDIWAVVSIGITYGGFVLYDNVIPKNTFFYLFTKERYFDPPDLKPEPETEREVKDADTDYS